MASAPGLRRVVLGESQKGEDGESLELSRKPLQHLVNFKPRPVINKQCVVAFVTLSAFVLLAIRLSFSFVVFHPHVTNHLAYSILNANGFQSAHRVQATIQRLASSDHPQLRQKEGISGKPPIPSRPRNARILARKSEGNFKSSRNCVLDAAAFGNDSRGYHSPKIFYQDFLEMFCNFKIFVYPHSPKDRFKHIFQAYSSSPTGNYASEHYFKMALLNSSLITKDPSKADLFYMPFSIAMMRNDPSIGVEGIKHFVKNYVSNITQKYSYWNRSSGADHFYVNCHSIGKTATETAMHVRTNAIQVVCSSSYHIQVYYPHKDATIPQVWPRTDSPKQAGLIEQRQTLAFFAGAGNSPVRALVAKHWVNDTEIKVYTSRIKTPYDVALLTSKYCLHVKGFEVNTARLADAMHYGCVPIIIANYHDLPFNDVLDWSSFSLVVTTDDIPRLKEIIKKVDDEEYVRMQKTVMQVRQHFEWHPSPQPFDAFYMVMYELWVRRHVVRFSEL